MTHQKDILDHFIVHRKKFDYVVIVAHTPVILLIDEIKGPHNELKKKYAKNFLEWCINHKVNVDMYVSRSGLLERFLRLELKDQKKQIASWKKLVVKEKQNKNLRIGVLRDEHMPSISSVLGRKKGEADQWDVGMGYRIGIDTKRVFTNRAESRWIGTEFPRETGITELIKDRLPHLEKDAIPFAKFVNTLEFGISNYEFKDEYFDQFDGSIVDFLLLQVDLAKHSHWFREKQPPKNSAKKELAMSFINELMNKKYDFHKFYWAGDGGVFVRKIESNMHDYDVVIDAADRIYELFDGWKKRHRRLQTKNLDLRVSAHTCTIFADKDRGFWTSEELNDFIKNEKKISGGGFGITKAIRKKLHTKSGRFNENSKLDVEIDSERWTIYYDSKHQRPKET